MYLCYIYLSFHVHTFLYFISIIPPFPYFSLHPFIFIFYVPYLLFLSSFYVRLLYYLISREFYSPHDQSKACCKGETSVCNLQLYFAQKIKTLHRMTEIRHIRIRQSDFITYQFRLTELEGKYENAVT